MGDESHNSTDEYSAEETEQRLRRTLRAAFNMKPTPLKAIPHKLSKAQPPRSAKRLAPEPKGVRRATAKSARRAT